MATALNRLGRETSPYLLQHRDNPVHWWAWGEEAFAAAREQNKPVLLSVGYAACHWCHVMAHESFEDPATAALMNELFINIKVDREERPDVDTIYQKALALMGEQGGWPLTIFLLPDGQPFWGGTYFPPAPRYGRPGFQQVLTQLSKVWREAPDKVAEQAVGLNAAVARRSADTLREPLSPEMLTEAAERLLEFFDHADGGLDGAPKFPMPVVWEFVWRAYKRTGDERFRSAVLLTLDRICQGGIYDHLGGGFARYSTDGRWLAPHFEKMLYDNAQLIALLTLVWQDTRADLFKRRVEETIAWLTREMTGENGGFAGALDADSEGEEGKFYVWTEAEIDAALGSDAPVFKKAYDVTPEGNWDNHTILNRLGQSAPDTPEAAEILARGRDKLLAMRAMRVRPGRDDKVLADWNGLAIEALVRAGLAFDRKDWIDLAARAFKAVCDTMLWRDEAGRGRLGHSFCAGRLQHIDVLDDYAHMANAALALHGATFADSYLVQARSWVELARDLFWDEAGGYFYTPTDRTDLIVRTKTVQDGAQPSGNGAMVLALARLHALTGEEGFGRRAEMVCQIFGAESMKSFPHAATLLNGVDLLSAPVAVVIAGDPTAADTLALLKAVHGVSEPNLVLAMTDDARPLPATHPAHGKARVSGKATAYVCRGPVCSAPMTDAMELATSLSHRA
ncbi:MAG: thioredoxin domain-containing protein [Rhodospirillaceae bacterium]|nr:thioredoxin domain-containing protein [Rhodospirillaceae bacterium]